MSSALARRILLVGIIGAASAAQLPAAPAALVRVEPGMEAAVKWKWKAVPSDERAWGLSVPLPPPTASTGALIAPSAPVAETVPATYEVKKGDALILIAKKLGLTVQQLKTFNALPSDVIRVGQVLNIPTHEEAKAIGPFPETEKKAASGKGKGGPSESLRSQLDSLPVQTFLDRNGFSIGPIDGQPSVTFEKVRQLYLTSHPGVPDTVALEKQSRAALGDGLTRYILRAEDFRFIAPPKAARYDASKTTPTPSASASKSKTPKAAPPTAVSYQDLVDAPMLAYRTPWEFVAERFHCDEAFLHALNSHITTVPTIGTEFRVPNVEPFVIEKALYEPLQPAPDAQRPVVASVVDMSLLTITQGGELIAVMPLSVARPGLRGRGTWTILNAIPRPRMATLQELAAPPKRVTQLYGSDVSQAATPKPILTSEQYLPPGPKNPVGVIWMNLAKAESIEPLPYGLTGTSTPDKMQTLESIGGFRLTNWDIARAARLLPVGTPLEWAQDAMVKPGSGSGGPTIMPAIPVSGDGPLFSQP